MKSMFALALAFGLLLALHNANAKEPQPALIEAIARQESGFNPLAVNVAEKSHYPATREEAESIIKAAQTAGKSYDVGLMQINSWWIDQYGIPAEKLLEPDFNAEWGKKILAAEIARYGLNWQAIGKYHSPDTERGRRYAWLIYYHYAG